jgi:hypothetical protein
MANTLTVEEQITACISITEPDGVVITAGAVVSISEGGGVTDHGDLDGLSTAGAHPATAIAFTPAGTIAATTVQAAIEEVATEAGGTPTVRALRALSVANHFTIPDVTSGEADYTIVALLRSYRSSNPRQNIVFGDRMKLQIDQNSNTRLLRAEVSDSLGALQASGEIQIPGMDLSPWGLLSVGRRNNGGTLEYFAGYNGARWYFTAANGGAPSAGGSIHLGSGDGGSPADKTDVAGYAVALGMYLDPVYDLDILDAALDAGALVQVAGLFDHLWQASAGGGLTTVVGAVDATLTGAALTVVTGVGRW